MQTKELICKVGLAIFTGTVATILSGCVSNTKMGADAMSEIQHAPTIHVVAYPSGLNVNTVKNAVTSGLITNMTGAEKALDGGSLIKKFGLQDASEEFTSLFVNSLKSEAQFTNLVIEPSLGGPLPEDTKSYGEKYPNSYVLDIQAGGLISYKPLAWSTYYFMQDARVRIIRTSDGAVLWNGSGTSGLGGATLQSDDLQMEGDGKNFVEGFHKTLALANQDLTGKFLSARK